MGGVKIQTVQSSVQDKKRESNRVFDVLDLGRMSYQEAWAKQKEVHAAVVAGATPCLLLVEHPAVLTLGRKAKEGDNIVVTREYLKKRGIDVFEVERGGDVTYHGEGQLVAYTIFPVGRRVRDFLRLLEEAVVQTLGALGLDDARPNPGYAGVYVDPREVNGLLRQQKICSIGVAVKQNVALHGIGLNISTNLDHFDLIVPCGLTDTQMTSVQREYDLRHLDRGMIEMDHAKQELVQAFDSAFVDYDWTVPKLV